MSRMADADRTAILDRAVTIYAKHGYRLESRAGWQAVVGRRQALNVPLALGLTVLTGGLWLIVLLIRLADRPMDRVVLTVDEEGLLVPEFRSS